jgi:O-antigen ligase
MPGALASLRSNRSPLSAFVSFALVAMAAYEVSEFILRGDVNSLIYLGMSIGVGIAVVTVLNDWRKGVYLFLTWILFEDLVRKYLGNNMAVYFAKDGLVLLLYLSFFRAQRSKPVEHFRPPFIVLLLCFFFLGFIQMFNPSSTSIYFGIMGMKLDFLYVPLLYVGYRFIDSERRLRVFFAFNSILILVVVCLGIAQAILGHTFLNPAVIQEDIRDLSTTYRASPITGLVAYRPTSVFVSAGRFQDFLVVSWILTLGYGGFLLLRSRRGRLMAFTCIGVLAAGSLLTASRGVLLWNSVGLFFIAFGFLWGAPWRNREGLRVIRTIQRVAIFIGVAIVALVVLFPQQLASRLAIYSETLDPTSPASELVSRSRDYPIQNFLLAFQYPNWPYGYGIGTTSLGVQYVARIMHAAPMRIGVESGYGQLLLELGILGLVLWIALATAISISAWRAAKSLRGSPWFPIAFGIFWYAFLLVLPISFYGFISYQDFVMNAYFWLLLGMLFRLQVIAKTPEFNTVAR